MKDHTERMLAQGRRWSTSVDNKVESAVNRAAQFLGVERPKAPADKLNDLRRALA